MLISRVGPSRKPQCFGFDGSPKAIEKWKAWLKAGYTSSAEAEKSRVRL